MKPEWFAFRPPPSTDRATETGDTTTSTIPWDSMWSDDKFWLPLMWDRRRFVGRADFSEFGDVGKGAKSEGEGTSMLRWWFASVDPEVTIGPP